MKKSDLPRCLIDLHLHLDGSLSLNTVRQLAAMQSIDLPEGDALLRRLRVEPDCRSLNEYLEKFAFPLSLMQTADAIRLSVRNLVQELYEAGYCYAEIRFAPQLHLQQGLTQREVIQAAADGLQGAPMPAGLILCCMRGNDNREQNLETVRVATEFLSQGVCSADLAGAEALFPTAEFAPLFALAQTLGVPYTIHAGEADGPESVKAALAMGTRRIGHGIRSVEDEALVTRLANEQVTLELCPTSNLHTCMYPSMEEYPLRTLLSAGVRCTINSDNMTVSGTDVANEYHRLIEALNLTQAEIKLLLQNAAAAAFAPEDVKASLMQTIDRECSKVGA